MGSPPLEVVYNLKNTIKLKKEEFHALFLNLFNKSFY